MTYSKDFVSYLLYIVACPVLGWGVTVCFYELAEILGAKPKKEKKLKCWSLMSVLVFLFAVLIKTFSS